MFRSALRGVLVATSIVCLTATTVRAQEPEDYSATGRRVAVAGEASVVYAGRDDAGFFNNTGYDVNALRLARVRLFGEWRLSEQVSVVGEVRNENAERVVVPALYLRWQPWPHRAFSIQMGRIPPVFGAYSRRPYGRDNVAIGEPLAYQYLTPLRPDALPATVDDLLLMRGRGWQPSYPIGSTEERAGVPLVSASRWDTGIEAAWQSSRLDLAGSVTLGAPAVPVVRDTNDGVSVAGRAAVHGPAGVIVGLSAARGRWIDGDVLDAIAGGRDVASSQTAVGADVELGSGPWLWRAEWAHVAFDLPLAVAPVAGGNAALSLSAQAAFVEARYRFRPRWQVGLRAERLSFGSIAIGRSLPDTTWDAPVSRAEAALGFRATRQIEVRAGWQQNWRDGGRVRHEGFPTIAVLCWF